MNFRKLSLSSSMPFIQKIGKMSFAVWGDPYSPKSIRARVKGKKHWVCFAEESGEKAGFVLGYDDNGKAYCWLLAVDPKVRRRRVGKALLHRFEAESKKRGYSAIVVKTHEKLLPMISLLKRLRYKEIRREPRHWGDERTAVFFEKKLA